MNKDIQHNQKAHDKIARVYNLKHPEIYNHYEQSRLQKVIGDLVKKVEEDDIKVLDMGAGTGNLSLKFLREGCEVIALDVSPKSLQLLERMNNYSQKLKTVVLRGKELPFPDNTFDIVSTYSVLHHIPDYLASVSEMIRVCKPNGYIYIDHEANENHWNPDPALREWRLKTKQNFYGYLRKIILTKEIFCVSLYKAVWIKLFINKRYEREGDIHVWLDDHIEWRKIKKVATDENCKIDQEIDYLQFRSKGKNLFDSYKDICSDTKLMIFQKCYL